MGPSEDMLQGLLAAAPDALLAIDGSGRIVFVNDQAERLFAWTRLELTGEQVECLIPERFRTGHPMLRRAYVQKPLTRPMGAGLDLWARRKDGSEFPAEISLSGFKTAGGERLVAVAIRDVTTSRRSEHRLKAVLASAPDAIVGVDATGRIELINGQAERLFGWSSIDLIGRQIEVLVPESHVDRHVHYRARFAREPSSRPMGAGLQLSGRRKDGTTFPAEISLSSLLEEDDSLLVLAAVRDVTDRVELEHERHRRALEAQREQSHRLESLGQLAGGVAHDFNNLLGVILNYSALLTRSIEDEQSLADIGEITAAAERAAALTRQLLAFARRDVTHPEPLDLNEVVSGFASLLTRTLGAHIDLRLELEATAAVIVADRHQVEQILLNLCLNSRDAMVSGGTLTIRTADRMSSTDGEGSASQVELSVVDSGVGMDREVLLRAFEPFFTTKPAGEGTGLGLATVYGIVGQNGGHIQIDSIVGSGTNVTIHFDRVDGPAAVPNPPVGGVTGGRERVLLVEDEPALRRVTARILVDNGYDVVVAGDGVEAIASFDRLHGEIDVVVTDIAMPRMRGDELAQVLAQRDPALRVIFMSGYASGEVPQPGLLLEKPVNEELLLRVIRDVLDG